MSEVDSYRYGVNPDSVEEAWDHFISLAREQLWKLDNVTDAIKAAPNIEVVRQIMMRHDVIHKELWFITESLHRIMNPAEPFPIQIMTADTVTGEQVYMVVYPEGGIGRRW